MRNGFCFLTDRLPTSIGKLALDTRTCTAVAVALKFNGDGTDAEKAMYVSQKLFHMPYSDALDKSGMTRDEFDSEVVRYLAGAPEAKSWKELHPDTSKTGAGDVSSEKRQTIPDFDFVQDSGAICSAFRQVYGMSLDEVCELHWWEFLELFRNLPADGNTFGIKRSIRNRKPDPKATPEQRKALADAKRSVRLKDTRSPEQKRRDTQAQFDALEL